MSDEQNQNQNTNTQANQSQKTDTPGSQNLPVRDPRGDDCVRHADKDLGATHRLNKSMDPKQFADIRHIQESKERDGK
jgi:hypothetical protein